MVSFLEWGNGELRKIGPLLPDKTSECYELSLSASVDIGVLQIE
jgi:hypothetical protein